MNLFYPFFVRLIGRLRFIHYNVYTVCNLKSFSFFISHKKQIYPWYMTGRCYDKVLVVGDDVGNDDGWQVISLLFEFLRGVGVNL